MLSFTLNFLNMGSPELILIGIVLFPLILIVVALVDVLKNKVINTNTKLLWIIVLFIAPVLGALIYLFWGKHQKGGI